MIHASSEILNGMEILQPGWFGMARSYIPDTDDLDQINTGGEKHILLVEDDTLTAFFLKSMIVMSDREAQVRSVKSAEQAEKFLKGLIENGLPGPDIALVDFALPKRDGLSICHLIEELFPDTKVTLMSAHSPSELKAEVPGGKLDVEFVRKPISRTKISDLLRM